MQMQQGDMITLESVTCVQRTKLARSPVAATITYLLMPACRSVLSMQQAPMESPTVVSSFACRLEQPTIPDPSGELEVRRKREKAAYRVSFSLSGDDRQLEDTEVGITMASSMSEEPESRLRFVHAGEQAIQTRLCRSGDNSKLFPQLALRTSLDTIVDLALRSQDVLRARPYPRAHGLYPSLADSVAAESFGWEIADLLMGKTRVLRTMCMAT